MRQTSMQLPTCWPVVFVGCTKAINTLCEHYTLQTVLIHTLINFPKHSIIYYTLSTIYSLLSFGPALPGLFPPIEVQPVSSNAVCIN